jgi:hypothetical protein
VLGGSRAEVSKEYAVRLSGLLDLPSTVEVQVRNCISSIMKFETHYLKGSQHVLFF